MQCSVAGIIGRDPLLSVIAEGSMVLSATPFVFVYRCEGVWGQFPSELFDLQV